MGISLSVYVGPYLKCSPSIGHDCDNLYDLIGNGECVGDFDLLGPNITMPEIQRQLKFARHQGNAVTPIDSIVREMALFESQFAHDIREIRGDYHSVEVCWGVVPGWF